jgi:hypothetical protein
MLYTVDPKLVIVSFGGMPIVGWGEDQIDVEKDEDNFNEQVGCTGETTRVHINNNNWTAKLTLLQSSPSNDYLSIISTRDVKLNLGVLPFQMKDILGTTLIFTPMAYIKKPAKADTGKTAKTRDWVLKLIQPETMIGGNIPTL